jgi:hypothetical protein|tara:strand:+ start:901 stop:1050 length:150 start_codon:yes stop_codon:yes gene_type:complete
MKNKRKNKNQPLPSATDDCADVTSKYDRFKKNKGKHKFPPVDYEKPPHY